MCNGTSYKLIILDEMSIEYFVMFPGGETDALLMTNDLLTAYVTMVTGTKCQNVNQAEYRSQICS